MATNLPLGVRAIAEWRKYNGRAGCDDVTEQLDANFALPDLCLKGFWATEAALSLAIMGSDLCGLFQANLGWLSCTRLPREVPKLSTKETENDSAARSPACARNSPTLSPPDRTWMTSFDTCSGSRPEPAAYRV